MPLPMIALMTSAVSVQRPMARTSAGVALDAEGTEARRLLARAEQGQAD
jgi:hypothetical protein